MGWSEERQLRSPDHEVRLKGVRSLARRPKPSHVPLLLTVAVDPYYAVRDAARYALNDCDPNWARTAHAQQMLPAFRAATLSDDYHRREAAVGVLDQIRDPKSFDTLLNVLGDGATLLAATEKALDNLDRNWRTSAAFRAHGPRLMKLARSSSYGPSEQVVSLLALIGDPKSADVLHEAVELKKNPYVALHALIKMRDPRAFAAAEAGLRGGDCHYATCIAGLGDPRTVPLLIELMPKLGGQVIITLGDLGDPRGAQALVDFHALEGAYPHPFDRDNQDRAYNMARIVTALQRILERSAGAVPANTLKAIIKLEDGSYRWSRMVRAPTACSDGDWYSSEERADFTICRQLARQELIRRGAA